MTPALVSHPLPNDGGRGGLPVPLQNPGGVPGGGREGVGGVARGRTFWRAPVPRAHSACAGLDANSASKLVFIDWTPKPLVNRRVISLDTVASLARRQP